MHVRKLVLAPLLVAVFCGSAANAQLPPSGTSALLPLNPTSADNLKLSMADRSCGISPFYVADAYRVSMSRNNITVLHGEARGDPVPLCPPPGPRLEIDLGRLPAGNYTISMINANFGGRPEGVVFSNVPFTVTDARALKTAPYVRLDYSGHWWDPNDSGWGLFIWHDARDNVLAAWFTYTPDGKPMWYVFQPKWETFARTTTVALTQTSRPPGLTSPPPGPTSYTAVGTASLDFTAMGLEDGGKLTYTFTGGVQTVRNIQRFKP